MPKFIFKVTERKTDGMCDVVFSDHTECWLREALTRIFGVADPGTYEVTVERVERVPPRAARINLAAHKPSQWYPYACGYCGGLLSETQILCDRCRRPLGEIKQLADLRIGGNGEPLVTGEE